MRTGSVPHVDLLGRLVLFAEQRFLFLLVSEYRFELTSFVLTSPVRQIYVLVSLMFLTVQRRPALFAECGLQIAMFLLCFEKPVAVGTHQPEVMIRRQLRTVADEIWCR
jgi:flagellar biosynthesis regulator FlbT